MALTANRERASGESRGEARVRAIVAAHFDAVWRLLRRLGVAPSSVDDAAQQVFIVAARKIDEIEAGGERRYLQGIAYRVASEQRRASSRRREDGPIEEAASESPLPDELVDRKRAREMLDRVLDAMPFDLRAVFVLFELDGLTVPEIAELLDLPIGTASSRLRRAREDFRSRVSEVRT